jgi:all-trans-retinol dehydrogenase (NAD+)
MKHLSGKVAVVTGAAMGMGKCISELLLKEGCKVALVDINRDILKKTQSELSPIGFCESYVCDISDPAEVSTLAMKIEKSMGTVSVLVNNAGIVVAKGLLEMDEIQIKKILDVNLTSMFWTTKAFLPGMISHDEGHVVNVASAGGILALPNLAAYCASKFGVIGFTDSLRQEMKKNKHHIGFTYVCPNTVGTGMFEGSKMATGTRELNPRDVSKKIIKSIKKNQAALAIPSIPVKFLTPLTKLILPVNVMDFLNRLLGLWRINDSWKGR